MGVLTIIVVSLCSSAWARCASFVVKYEGTTMWMGGSLLLVVNLPAPLLVSHCYSQHYYYSLVRGMYYMVHGNVL